MLLQAQFMQADEAASIREAIIAKLKQAMKELFEARSAKSLKDTEDQIALYTALIKIGLALNVVLADRQADIVQKAVEEAQNATTLVENAADKVGKSKKHKPGPYA